MVSVSRDPWVSEEKVGRKPLREKELFPLESGRERRERTDAGEGLWCQAQLYRQGFTPEEKEMTKKELPTCFSGEEAGGKEAIAPVSEQTRQEEKGEAAT